jgi:hypothetical protein
MQRRASLPIDARSVLERQSRRRLDYPLEGRLGRLPEGITKHEEPASVPLPNSLLVVLLLLVTDAGTSPTPAPGHETPIALSAFTVFKEDSGPVNYYTLLTEGDAGMIRAVYTPGLKTVVLDAVVPKEVRQRVMRVSWRWRVHTLPRDANDCGPGFPDSAASVFLAFKAGLKVMVLKYVWSTTGSVGTTCQSTRGWFFDRDTTLVEVGGPLDVWKRVEVDPRAEFARHYGVKPEDVPDFVAIGMLTDGDQSESAAQADYADFVVHW